MKAVRIILMILTAGLYSCPCVTDLDTDKITEPEKYANIVFVNCIWQSGNIKILDKYDDTLAYTGYSKTSFSHVKVAAEIENFLKVVLDGSGSTLYFSPVILRDRENLTFISYGDTLHTAAILLNDSIPGYSPNNVYIRLVNVLPENSVHHFDGTGNYPVDEKLGFGEYSQILTTYTAKAGIEIKNDSGLVVCQLKDYNFTAGRLYVLILRRSPGKSGNPECLPVELTLIK